MRALSCRGGREEKWEGDSDCFLLYGRWLASELRPPISYAWVRQMQLRQVASDISVQGSNQILLRQVTGIGSGQTHELRVATKHALSFSANSSIPARTRKKISALQDEPLQARSFCRDKYKGGNWESKVLGYSNHLQQLKVLRIQMICTYLVHYIYITPTTQCQNSTSSIYTQART